MTLETLIWQEACSESLAWLGNRSVRTAWRVCPRADWLLWVLERVEPPPSQRLALLACDLVERYRKVWEGIPAARQAVRCMRRWGQGCATREDLLNAEAALRSALERRRAVLVWEALWFVLEEGRVWHSWLQRLLHLRMRQMAQWRSRHRRRLGAGYSCLPRGLARQRALAFYATLIRRRFPTPPRCRGGSACADET